MICSCTARGSRSQRIGETGCSRGTRARCGESQGASWRAKKPNRWQATNSLLGDQIGRARIGSVPAQMRQPLRAPGFVRVVRDELRIAASIFGDDFHAVLVGATVPVGAEAVEDRSRRRRLFDSRMRDRRRGWLWEMLIVDTQGEAVLGALTSRVCLRSLHHGRREVLRRDAVPAAITRGTTAAFRARLLA